MLGYRVSCYINNRNHRISVKKGSKVILHTNLIALQNVTFTVQEAGRQKTLSEGRIYTHSFVKGTIAFVEANNGLHFGELLPPTDLIRVEAVYDPHEYGFFYDRDTERQIVWATYATVTPDSIIVYGPRFDGEEV